MTHYYMLVPQDIVNTKCILYSCVDGKYYLRPEYKSLQCALCGKLNEIAALDQFVPRNLHFKLKMPDFFPTQDGFQVISDKFYNILHEYGLIMHVNIYELDPNSIYRIAIPHFIETTNRDALTVSDICHTCRRPRESILGSSLEELPDNFQIGSLRIESPTNITPLWIVSEAVMKILKKGKLRGMEFHPYFRII